jgi:hypothetical protein
MIQVSTLARAEVSRSAPLLVDEVTTDEPFLPRIVEGSGMLAGTGITKVSQETTDDD